MYESSRHDRTSLWEVLVRRRIPFPTFPPRLKLAAPCGAEPCGVRAAAAARAAVGGAGKGKGRGQGVNRPRGGAAHRRPLMAQQLTEIEYTPAHLFGGVGGGPPGVT